MRTPATAPLFAFVPPTEADKALPAEGEPYAVLFEHGTLELGWYAPEDVDDQQPHDRDELYFMSRGRAHFWVEGEERREVYAGDALFVAAHRAHRFERMSHDFRTWVAFYGPKGGER